MKKILVIISVFVFMAGLAQGQDLGAPKVMGTMLKSYYTFNWNTTFTMGDFNKWVGQASPAGFGFSGRRILNGKFILGGDISWQRVAQDYPMETYQDPANGMAITATNYRFTWMVPFGGTIGYQMMSDKMVSPYVALGIGGDYMEHHLIIQEIDRYKERWDFSLTPEIGAVIRFGNFAQWGALVAFNYKWTTNQIELMNKTSKDLSMLNLKIGLAYLIF
ncbi:MAG: hypothetical protein WCL00_11925 [Bacteroidota bacterium]